MYNFSTFELSQSFSDDSGKTKVHSANISKFTASQKLRWLMTKTIDSRIALNAIKSNFRRF